MVSTRRQSASAEQNGAAVKSGKSNGATPSKRKAQEALDAPNDEKSEEQPEAKQQKKTSEDEKSKDIKQDTDQKEDTNKEEHGQKEADEAQETKEDSKPSSTAKPSQNEDKKDKLQRLVSSFGQPPLQHLIPKDASGSQIVMIHILNALLASARVSHTIAGNTLECLIKENYQDLAVLEGSSWEQRCKVLTEGGYTRYREKTATYLGELSDLMKDKYDNDAEKILPKDEKGQPARDTLSHRLEEIKGLGPVGIDIFLGGIQGFFTNVAPFLDKRSKGTAEKIGLGDDVEGIFEMVGSKAGEMAKVEVGLTMVRLGKKEGEFE